jgi:hypothetical protein
MALLSAGLTHDRSDNQDKNEHFHCESLRVRHQTPLAYIALDDTADHNAIRDIGGGPRTTGGRGAADRATN